MNLPSVALKNKNHRAGRPSRCAAPARRCRHATSFRRIDRRRGGGREPLRGPREDDGRYRIAGRVRALGPGGPDGCPLSLEKTPAEMRSSTSCRSRPTRAETSRRRSPNSKAPIVVMIRADRRGVSSIKKLRMWFDDQFCRVRWGVEYPPSRSSTAACIRHLPS
jgi:hypothetical protein